MQFTDQNGNIIKLFEIPKKIISVVPSQTELLFDLGLNDEVIGITKFCIHPEKWFREKERIGGTKKLNIEKIKALNPDLIIANKEENIKEDIEELQKYFPVWISDIYSLDDALNMIEAIGKITDASPKAKEIINLIKQEFSRFEKSIVEQKTLKTAYFIWYNPIMAAGNNTFIHSMLELCKFDNVFKNMERYPEITEEQLKIANPELILLSSEPFPFKEKHVAYFKSICPNAIVKLVDGEMFSWYGSRLTYSANYFKQLRNEITI
ncbi:MAG: iron ABC transporter [Candidatus Woesearchaeota archaeon]|nr:MAG: iron ABC transporter [Candidatus Woesearchaeota archaeon]